MRLTVLAWAAGGFLVALMVLSLTGPANGYGWMSMGWMWVWMVLPVLALLFILAQAMRSPPGGA